MCNIARRYIVFMKFLYLCGSFGALAVLLSEPMIPVVGLVQMRFSNQYHHPRPSELWLRRRRSVILHMGLYDTPLPPRSSSPHDDDPSSDGEDDDEEATAASPPSTPRRLFQFNADGTEQKGFLPRLKRSLESGIGCYFETSDRKVQNLVSKTECHPEDAAWALEACRGDITEAWTRISTARRIILNRNDDRSAEEKEESAASAREELEAFKEKLQQQEQKRRRDEYFKGSKPDAEWLPQTNPKPIDDEPWFTG